MSSSGLQYTELIVFDSKAKLYLAQNHTQTPLTKFNRSIKNFTPLRSQIQGRMIAKDIFSCRNSVNTSLVTKVTITRRFQFVGYFCLTPTLREVESSREVAE